MSCAVLPADAEIVHKWVDTNGLTHYSDEISTPPRTQVTLIEISQSKPLTNNTETDYYSIKNQWRRLHKERIDLEKLKSEKARLEAAQQPVAPQIVDVNEPKEKRYVVAIYPRFLHRRHGHRRFHYYSKYHIGGAPNKHRREKQPGRLHRIQARAGAYKYMQ